MSRTICKKNSSTVSLRNLTGPAMKHELAQLQMNHNLTMTGQGFLRYFPFLLAKVIFYHACVNARWRKEGCVVTQAGSFSSKQHCLFLPLPGFLCLCALACATLFTELWLLLNASHAYDSGLLPGEGSVPVKNTHARMIAQMHDSLMSQRPEAKHACSHGFTWIHMLVLWYCTHGVKCCYQESFFYRIQK